MKTKQIVEAVQNGTCLVVVEYRAFKLETIKFRDKKTGAMVEKMTIKHSVEAGDTQMSLVEWLPDGADTKALQPLYKKGEKCVLVVKSLEQDMGFMRATGDLVPLEPDAEAPKK